MLRIIIAFIPIFWIGEAMGNEAGVFGVPGAEPEKAISGYISKDRVEVKLSPDKKGKVTNRLDYGGKVEIFAIRNGWVRISRFYDGEVEGVKGTVARWIESKYVQDTEPKRRGTDIASNQYSKQNAVLAKALMKSDDFRLYWLQFHKTANELISEGKCSVEDFKNNGGWTRSTSYPNTYFVFCGGYHRKNRIYLHIEETIE